jgi:SRSO17 transposase
MSEIQSEKKIFQKSGCATFSIRYIRNFVSSFNDFFWSHHFSNSFIALQYIKGLLVCERGKANMERMEEEVPDSEYRAYQQFISNSKWDYLGVNRKVATDTSILLAQNKKCSGCATGFIIDESAHLKKGECSVGVGKQYAGVVGKVENCQVGVYASLVNDSYATLIGQRLFLPQKWTGDARRCDKAGVPKEARQYKTKPQMALELVDEALANGVQFDWIGGDGLYGHSYELGKGLDERDRFFVLDAHKDELVYLQKPALSIPTKTGRRGRPARSLQSNVTPIRLDKYMQSLQASSLKEVSVRKTTKGWLKLRVHLAKVWVWDGEEKEPRERCVIITQTLDEKGDIKYSFSNGRVSQYSHQQYAYFQSQRYWVERCFEDAKNELGLSDYQVRKWLSWNHHHSLVMMACLFIMKLKMDHKIDYPLLSVRDARILMIVKIFGTESDFKRRLEQMYIRHQKRQTNIDRFYKNESFIKSTS